MQAVSRVRRPDARRRGFTIIELLVVVLVISMLVALLMPALGSARRTVRIAQVRSEISQLEQAIAAFRARFNMDPPSRIVLYEVSSGWTNTDADTMRSRTLIRKIWPQFDFGQNYDLNGNNQYDSGQIVLTGPECLVFFLGGIVQNEVATGFSKNERTPFAPGGPREGPFFEFDIGRLVDLDNDGMFEYLDPLPGARVPYMYASSYDGQGYDPNELNIGSIGMQDVYRQRPYDPNNPTATPTPAQKRATPAWNPRSYQIISPGFDQEFGIGGHFNPDEPLVGHQDRFNERDNITNFHTGTLK